MAPKSTLEHDLLKNADDRLVQWRNDTIMRCEVVDLDFRCQAGIIFSCLTGELIRLASLLRMSDSDFGILMQNSMQQFKKEYGDKLRS